MVVNRSGPRNHKMTSKKIKDHPRKENIPVIKRGPTKIKKERDKTTRMDIGRVRGTFFLGNIKGAKSIKRSVIQIRRIE